MDIKWTKSNIENKRKWIRKIESIKYLGGVCLGCGDSDILHLTFHHKLDDKDKNISSLFRSSWEKLKLELDKCELLCNNCHREKHFIENENSQCSRRKNKLIFLSYKREECIECGYNRCPSSLTFHHLGNKKFNIGNVGRHFTSLVDLDDVIKNELDKCIVLCANCHFKKRANIEIFDYVISNIDSIKIKKISPKINREEVKKMYSEGMTQKKISEILNCAKSTISEILSNKK